MINIYISIIYLVHVIFSIFKIRTNRITGLIIIIYFLKYQIKNINIDIMSIFYICLGYVIGIIWIMFFSKLINYKYTIKGFIIKMKFNYIIVVIIEEIIWRACIQKDLYNYFNNYFYNKVIIKICIILIIAILFTLSHKIKKDKIYFIEFIMFSIILGISNIQNIYIPIGIHICRNNYIINLKHYEV